MKTSLNNVKEAKQLIRNSFKLIRNNLDLSFVQTKSLIIYKKFKNIVNINKFNSISVYIDFNNEVSTYSIIKYALDNKIKISVPFLIDNHNMKLKYINDYDKDINRNTKFGNGEPFEYCKDCDIEEVSMFIIPALVFDEKCGRLGFGSGYYDNILKLNKNALRVGLAYDYQILPSIPKDDNDEILDIIISESKIITAYF
ncbi:5-formyltetrahydrofolate cyclo-ligase [uncultured Brachyspira sp.]|uniref:5-formyltetrahydrofolate cyclo-ligase n=1 Tax=uncultured Brachyspira sp. TaxID=221953 RepID=UPI00262DC9C6|nr:5-formyltetrahydrofolate cyclo-ligase [uncultured Brachyspira sp.]